MQSMTDEELQRRTYIEDRVMDFVTANKDIIESITIHWAKLKPLNLSLEDKNEIT